MTPHIPAALYHDLVLRDGVGCGSDGCTFNASSAIKSTEDQWGRFSTGAKVGIIVGASVAATLVLVGLVYCIRRCCRDRSRWTKVRPFVSINLRTILTVRFSAYLQRPIEPAVIRSPRSMTWLQCLLMGMTDRNARRWRGRGSTLNVLRCHGNLGHHAQGYSF